MRVAVLTMTRDRLDYTQHCYGTLLEHSGCDFDHYVLDQGSTDGTVRWLEDTDATVVQMHGNIGICKALNLMLKTVCDPADYDVICRWDNDCELQHPDTLLTVATEAYESGWILAPQVNGLQNPPAMAPAAKLGKNYVKETQILGGVFMAIPADLFTDWGFRYDETQPLWAGDELICQWWRERGGHCGYLMGYSVNHYLGTSGQQKDKPEYFRRRVLEGGPV